MNRRATSILALAACAALPAQADNLALTGAEVSRDGNHAYLGTILRPDPASIWRGKLWMDSTRYDYDKAGATIKAHASGLEAAIGIGGHTGADWWAAYLGPRYERVSLSPNDPANDSRGSQLRGKLQAETENSVGGAWRLNAGASYIFGAEKYWVRGRLMHPLAPRSAAGIELLRHGGTDYTATQMGGLYSMPLGASSSVTFKGGLRRDESQGSSGYGGIEFSVPY